MNWIPLSLLGELELSFLSFVPVGVLAFAVILAVGIGAALLISGRV